MDTQATNSGFIALCLVLLLLVTIVLLPLRSRLKKNIFEQELRAFQVAKMWEGKEFFVVEHMIARPSERYGDYWHRLTLIAAGVPEVKISLMFRFQHPEIEFIKTLEKGDSIEIEAVRESLIPGLGYEPENHVRINLLPF